MPSKTKKKTAAVDSTSISGPSGAVDSTSINGPSGAGAASNFDPYTGKPLTGGAAAAAPAASSSQGFDPYTGKPIAAGGSSSGERQASGSGSAAPMAGHSQASAAEQLQAAVSARSAQGGTAAGSENTMTFMATKGGSATAGYGEAFGLVKRAKAAESSREWVLAVQMYLEAGQALLTRGEQESNHPQRKRVLRKANQLWERAQAIQTWLEQTKAQQAAQGTAQGTTMSAPTGKGVSAPQNPTSGSPAAPPAAPMPEASTGAHKDVRATSIEFTRKEHPPPYTEGEEFTHITYTPVVCPKPFDFTSRGYKLRCRRARRRIRFLCVITMYNEDASELEMTLRGICENVQFMCGTYGENVWEELAVAIVSDGRSKANEKTLDWMTERGLFDEKLMTVEEVGLTVDMHLFEHTMQTVKSWNPQVNRGAYFKPLQAIFALKQLNAGKLNSHLWFFNAFAEQLLPEYTVLLDVGTIPGKDAIFRLIRSMDRDPFMAGVCGEIAVFEPKLSSFIESSQNFEYKVSNIMDKSLESLFGFISVLPGAFSAYRYCAIRMDDEGEGPLAEYFRSINTSMRDLGPFKGNMYLAEDRILCFELLARKNCRWTLHYVKDAIAHTDVPMDLVSLIGQRRRWLNGSFFASLYALGNFGQFWSRSTHSFPHKCAITFQFGYLGAQLVLNWVLAANFFLTVYYILDLTFPNTWIYNLIFWSYITMVMTQFIVGLGNKPKAWPGFYNMCSTVFGWTMTLVFCLTIYQFFHIATGNQASEVLLGQSSFKCMTGNFNNLGFIIPGANNGIKMREDKNWKGQGDFANEFQKVCPQYTVEFECMNPKDPDVVPTPNCTTFDEDVYLPYSGPKEQFFPWDCKEPTYRSLYCLSFRGQWDSSRSREPTNPTQKDKQKDEAAEDEFIEKLRKRCEGAHTSALIKLNETQKLDIYPPKKDADGKPMQRANPDYLKPYQADTVVPVGEKRCVFNEKRAREIMALPEDGVITYDKVACGQCPGLQPKVQRASFDACTLNGAQIMLLAIFSLGCYFIAGLLHCELYHICTSLLQYFFMLPMFVNVLQIYSICNLHDLSWGTKGLDSVEQEVSDAQVGANTVEDLIARRKEAQAKAAREAADAAKLEDEFKAFRSQMVIFWLLCNGLVVALMISYVSGQCFLTFLAFVVAAFNGMRLVGSIVFILLRSARGAVTSKDYTKQVREKHVATDDGNPNTVAFSLKAPLMANQHGSGQ